MNKTESAQIPPSSITLFEFLDSKIMREPPTGESTHETLRRLVAVEGITFFHETDFIAREVVTSNVRLWAERCVEAWNWIHVNEVDRWSPESIREYKRATSGLAARLEIDPHRIRMSSADVRRARVAILDSDGSHRPSTDDLERAFRIKRSQKASNARYGTENKRLEQAELEAERLLGEGSVLSHVEMTDRLLALEHPKGVFKFKDLPRTRLRNRIKRLYIRLGRQTQILGHADYIPRC